MEDWTKETPQVCFGHKEQQITVYLLEADEKNCRATPLCATANNVGTLPQVEARRQPQYLGHTSLTQPNAPCQRHETRLFLGPSTKRPFSGPPIKWHFSEPPIKWPFSGPLTKRPLSGPRARFSLKYSYTSTKNLKYSFQAVVLPLTRSIFHAYTFESTRKRPKP